MQETSRLAAAIMVLAACSRLFAAGTTLPPMIDAHAHYTATDAAALSPAEVLARLDAAGVSRLVVSGSPPELAQRLAKHAPSRVIPLLGIYGTGLDKANWMHDGNLPKVVAAQLDAGTWAGIGELHLFAKDAHSPVFTELVRMAEARELVLMIHGDAKVVSRAFELAPGVRVLWAHLGTEPKPALLAGMLARYPNTLWIDTSVRDERIAPKGKLLPAWRNLFMRYPDRFMAAVDTFSVNRWQQYGAVTAQIRTWMEPLPESVKSRLLHDNAARLFEPYLRRDTGSRNTTGQ